MKIKQLLADIISLMAGNCDQANQLQVIAKIVELNAWLATNPEIPSDTLEVIPQEFRATVFQAWGLLLLQSMK